MKARERLALYGADGATALDLLECLAGDRIIAQRLAAFPGGVPALAEAEPAEIAALPGVSEALAARVTAAFRLHHFARRQHSDTAITCAELAAVRLRWMSDLTEERFVILGLDVKNRVILEREVFRGTTMGVEVHPREVFNLLIRARAVAFIMAHNHPSGDPTPSVHDRALTTRFKRVGKVTGIPILDHVVVAASGYASVVDETASGSWSEIGGSK